MKRFLKIAGVFLLLLVIVLLVNTFRLTSVQLNVPPAEKISVDESKLLSDFREAIRFKTISNQEKDFLKTIAIHAFQDFLRSKFPLVFQKMETQNTGTLSIVLKWEGRNKTLVPILIMSHQDVVPIEDTVGWEHPAFDGFADDQFIYGRGTLDDKCGVLGILEAAELMSSKGFQPDRTVYFSFGPDEETGGEEGAKKVAAWFRSQNISFESILDEGGTIVDNVVPGVKAPVALIGIAEKGYASIRLTVETEGGHSSMPSPQTATGILCTAVSKLENNPFETSLLGATKEMFTALAPEMDFGTKLAFANQWLLKTVIIGKMKKKNSSYAAIHTTTAVTILRSGTKDNMLPSKASAIVNFRILTGESTESTMNQVKKIINDERVKLEFTGHINEPSPVSEINSAPYQTLNQTIREVFPGTLVAPYLVLASTDAKHFAGMSNCIFRFIPIELGPDDLKRIHGKNERISKSNYFDIVRFYVQYMNNSTKN